MNRIPNRKPPFQKRSQAIFCTPRKIELRCICFHWFLRLAGSHCTHCSATDWNERRTGDYSFLGSAWDRIGVEAPASRVHKQWMNFGEAEPRLQ